jgi:hypothetical protein
MSILKCIFSLALVALAIAPTAMSQGCGPIESSALRALLKDTKLAREHPDEFNWKVFALISYPVKSKPFVANNHQTLLPNNVLWETWADDDYTFPSSPNPKIRRTWCGRNSTIQLSPDPLAKFFEKRLLEVDARLSDVDTIGGGFQNATGPDAFGGEEVRRNKTAFTFIAGHNLWYQEGLARSGFDAQGKMRKAPLNFPKGSIEIKAVWKTIFESQKGTYHWNYGQNGQLYGLLSLHIITKTLDKWTWATWEHVDNLRRCDEIGCSDSYGSQPAIVPSAEALGHAYPPGNLTPNVLKLFRDAGVKPEWQNYRLKGSQVDPMNKRYLGNTQMEGSYLPTASCISCHARASVRCNGQTDVQLGLNADKTGPNGSLDTLPSDQYPTDFVWAFFLAKPVNPNRKSCLPTTP